MRSRIVGPSPINHPNWSFIKALGPFPQVFIHYIVYRPYLWSYLFIAGVLKLRFTIPFLVAKTGSYTIILPGLAFLIFLGLTSTALKLSVGLTLLIVRDT